MSPQGHLLRKASFFAVAAILLATLGISGILAAPPQASAGPGSGMLASLFAETSTLKNLRSIQYTTKSTLSYVPGICGNGNCNPDQSEAHFISGVGNNNYWYQCGIRYNQDLAKWQVWFEYWDTNRVPHDLISTANLPSGSTVTLKLGVPAYTGASNVQCEAYWGSSAVIFGSDSNVATYFKRTSTPNAYGQHTSVMSEYYRAGMSDASKVSLLTYTKVKLVDTSNASVSLTKVNQMINNMIVADPIGFSGVKTLPNSYTYKGFTVSTTTSNTVTTT